MKRLFILICLLSLLLVVGTISAEEWQAGIGARVGTSSGGDNRIYDDNYIYDDTYADHFFGGIYFELSSENGIEIEMAIDGYEQRNYGIMENQAFSVIPLTITGKYLFAPKAVFTPYAGGGIGTYIMTNDWYEESVLGFQMVGGVELMPRGNVSLCMEIAKSTALYQGQDIGTWRITGGVTLNFSLEPKPKRHQHYTAPPPKSRPAPRERRNPPKRNIKKRVWIEGHWEYKQGRRVWVPSHWEYR